jgi:NAD(P)-dependent dehydrogenase (short-subunit alcohol dehydrogenase family)
MLDRYSDSKFANVLFTNGLNQRLAKYPHIKTASLHPGVVSTNFGKEISLM